MGAVPGRVFGVQGSNTFEAPANLLEGEQTPRGLDGQSPHLLFSENDMKVELERTMVGYRIIVKNVINEVRLNIDEAGELLEKLATAIMQFENLPEEEKNNPPYLRTIEEMKRILELSKLRNT